MRKSKTRGWAGEMLGQIQNTLATKFAPHLLPVHKWPLETTSKILNIHQPVPFLTTT